MLTEDFNYLKWNEVETKKTAPKYCSSYVLLRELYKQGKISFDKYLSCTSYLVYNRYGFIPLYSEDIEKAVFGYGIVKDIHPENIRRFNLPLILSEEYGIELGTAYSVIQPLLVKTLLDNAIFIELAERVFFEVLEAFPYKGDKKMLAYVFMKKLDEDIKKSRDAILIGQTYQEKRSRIVRGISILNYKESIITL